MKSPIPILDCHGHIGVHPDFPAYKTDPDEMVHVMDALNIERLAVTSTLACFSDCPRGNAEIAEVLQRHPQRFLGYITVNPNPKGEALQQLEKYTYFHHPPLIKFHPDLHQYPVTGPNYLPIWDYAHQTHAIVLVHTWDSDANCGPLLFAKIAKEFPYARILLGHSGVSWRGYQQAIDVAKEAPNTYLDISGSQSHRTVLELCVAEVGAHRVLFGSDMPYLEGAISLGRVLTSRITDDAKQAILRENFLRLLTKH
jgi:predicted TIM-barrel fold metal-dependent hydrolase